MPQKAWSAKREPQPLAEEIAARVFNRDLVQHGESVEACPSSINDMSSSRRGGACRSPLVGVWH